MLPTPDTSHVPYNQVYEPAEDSFLLLDTLSSASETTFLTQRFTPPVHTPSTSSTTTTSSSGVSAPLVVEVGTGSGVVLAFVNAHARLLFGTSAVLTAGIDVNGFACAATRDTVVKAAAGEKQHDDSAGAGAAGAGAGLFLGAVRGDLLSPLGEGQVDVLIFNPPYVPTEELPAHDLQRLAADEGGTETAGRQMGASARFERDSYLLSLSYAGGRDGMEVTDRLLGAMPRALSRRGCAYVLLCAGNGPEVVKARIEGLGPEWRVRTVGDSGKQAGWEKLQIIRIWREYDEPLQGGGSGGGGGP